MEFSRQEYWSGLPFPSPGDLGDPGTESRTPELQADSLLSEPSGKSNRYILGNADLRITETPNVSLIQQTTLIRKRFRGQSGQGAT